MKIIFQLKTNLLSFKKVMKLMTMTKKFLIHISKKKTKKRIRVKLTEIFKSQNRMISQKIMAKTSLKISRVSQNKHCRKNSL